MTPDLSLILNAHGGLDYWRSLERIDIEFSAGGFLFRSKAIPPLRHARMSLRVQTPEVTFQDYPRPGMTGRFLLGDRVEILDAGGRTVQFRERPREAFRHWRRFFHWDALDFAYFAGYAMWNYLTMPYLLTRPGVALRSAPWGEGGVMWQAEFPEALPTHCRRQFFYFTADGLLARHDYVAEVVGSWARAAHLSSEYRDFGGLRLPTRRRVHPLLGGDRPLPFPVLVAIDLHAAAPVTVSG